MKTFLPLALLIMIGCSSPNREENTSSTYTRPLEWQGKWNARWETLASSYPGVTDKDFSMNGVFDFSENSLTVLAQGYPDCIFSEDTLAHTQSWHVSNDTLFLYNNSNLPGMTYVVKSISNSKIKLQLMSDIFVTLTK